MRKRTKDFIQNCDTCEHHKTEQVAPAGLLQPLVIPCQIWEDISMDFIDGLPSSNGKTTIFVVVDRLSKYAHFTAISHPYTSVGISRIFHDNILHSMPRSIVCDRDPTFTSAFWREVFRLNSTTFNFKFAYHPQTDGKSEVVNLTGNVFPLFH